MNKIEIWKDIEGYEGLYQISSFGRVKSFVYKEKILKPTTGRTDGYVRISLHKDRRIRTYTIHRLVACAFIPPIADKPYINHIDGNKQNNYVGNLEWCTASENQFHAVERGLSSINHPKKSKAVDMFSRDGELIATFPSLAEAHRQTTVAISNIYQCCKHGCKTAGGYVWRYHNEDMSPKEKSEKEFRINKIITELYNCTDIALLDLIQQLLGKVSGAIRSGKYSVEIKTSGE